MSTLNLPHNHHQETADYLENMPQTTEFQAASDVFKLLGDTSRIRIFWLLCHCEECVINISSIVEMSSPAVSHHLRLLKTSGLIVSRREGKEMYYKAADTPTAQLLHETIEQMIHLACPFRKEENHVEH
ncbi:MAG: metalloregulator ArsR/SmtB family transcription factor [Eubacteriales bacterium]|nr:metalloregulator ArsR/SmtB family transcription factor [Eubacteriales bacterium]